MGLTNVNAIVYVPAAPAQLHPIEHQFNLNNDACQEIPRDRGGLGKQRVATLALESMDNPILPAGICRRQGHDASPPSPYRESLSGLPRTLLYVAVTRH
jgi:hypothetical protein